MADKLTVRPAGSLESISSFESNTDDSEADSLNPTTGKDKFITGVRRGFKKFGTFRERPQDILTAESSSIATAAAPLSAPVTATQLPSRSALQHGRSLSSTANLEKPLPKPPQSPSPTIVQEPFSDPPDTPKPPGTMLRGTPDSSRTSTMDSMTSGPPLQSYGGIRPSPTAFLADANESQSSFASSTSYIDGESQDGKPDLVTPRSAEPASAGPSPAGQGQAAGGAAHTLSAPNSSTHLSGLMCNVHRTTGREPYPLVGATTTILGDKLYVFGGRILSRTRPVLTSDLYELDLIRRHWTKLEPSGDVPPPRYFHSMCALGDGKLVCYGGMSPAPSSIQAAAGPVGQNGQDPQPEVVVMSDIHIYDVATNSWSYIPTQDTPQGRYAHCATILPSSATFSSVNAPLSALHHNPSSGNPNQGSIGVNIDGSGGAEMVVVGGQDSANHYIEQISVFNLRSLRWTSTQQLGKSCGAYRSVVAPLPGIIASRIGKGASAKSESSSSGISQEAREPGSSMLIYSNYNFLDVKLELQIRSADGTLSEKPMLGSYTPPGLRFPNGGLIDAHFVVSGTYLTSSKQEYALWALDLRTLTWTRIDAGGSVFSQGSWNRGVLWNRRNTFVILGNRKRSLVEDYNHRRLNFTNVCMVELEAFGLYDNPRKSTPMSGFTSASAPPPTGPLPHPLGTLKQTLFSSGGRTLSKAAEDLGNIAMSMKEISDMDILTLGGERIPVNSRIVARRWGPYFIQLLREASTPQDNNDTATLRPNLNSANDSSGYAPSHPSRNSSITITPSFTGQSSNLSTSSTLNDTNSEVQHGQGQNGRSAMALSEPPDPMTIPPVARPRTLYLPHTYLTIQALLYFLYTSSLPPSSSPLCTPQILCSLLQLARPYQIDGLAEAIVEKLHGVLDSRNAAAVFNAAAMAAGGGRGLMPASMDTLDRNARDNAADLVARTRDALRINTSVGNLASGMRGRNMVDSEDDDDPASAASSVSSAWEGGESGQGSEASGRDGRREEKEEREIWNGEVSCVIGLQKRGLRGLMEGRRLRERGASISRDGAGVAGARLGLGIA